MSPTLYRRLSLSFLVVLIAIGMIVLVPAESAQQEPQERLIEKKSWPAEPIKILKLKAKDKDIESGKKFLEDDDWLRGLTVRAKNISNKPIARIEILLSFPRPKDIDAMNATPLAVSMIYGKEPSHDAVDQEYVLPDESVDVKLIEANLPFIKTAMKKLGYPDKVTQAQIMVDSVTFSDGTTWAGNTTLYPDPDNPGQKRNPLVPKSPRPRWQWRWSD